jgi:hypothetical protein
MHTIKRSDGLILCDGPVYTNKSLPQPIWQKFKGSRQVYLEESLEYATARCRRLEKIYIAHSLHVHELTAEEMEYLSFRKLRGY